MNLEFPIISEKMVDHRLLDMSLRNLKSEEAEIGLASRCHSSRARKLLSEVNEITFRVASTLRRGRIDSLEYTDAITFLEQMTSSKLRRLPGLHENETYQFRVRAVNAAGEGAASGGTEPVTCRPFVEPPGAPDAPRIGTVILL